MIPFVNMWLTEAPWLEFVVLFIDLTFKGAVLCAAAAIATLLLRRSSAFTRNTVWVFALVGLILLPAFSLLTPVWNLPIIPDIGSWGSGVHSSDFELSDKGELVGPPTPVQSGAQDTSGRPTGSMPVGIPWYAWGILVWMAGGFFYLSWCLILHASVRSIVKKAVPAKREWRAVFDGVVAAQDLRRKVKLLESERIKTAITVGIFEPVVVLPSDSDGWPEERRRLVLSHELAHVKRWDTLIEAFALLVTVVYWFNPLVWFAVKQLRIERERDCDNAVLGAGAKPSDYAELLMNIAADLGDPVRPVWRLSTISQSSNLKDRLMSILNQKINRNRGSRRSAILTGALVLTLALPISAMGLWSPQGEKQTEKDKQAKEKVLKAKQIEQAGETKVEKKKMSAEEKAKLTWKKICENENSAACKVAVAMKKEGPDAGVKTFYKMKQANQGEYVFKEKEFNALGYAFLYSDKVKEAVAVFEINVKEYPDSWNVYDSLGEAYMVAGKYEKATKYYEKALSMNPEAESSKTALAKIAEKKKEQSNTAAR